MAKLFRENIARRDAVPRLTGKFVLRVARRRDVAEIHFRHVANFIVIIKHHTPVTGDTEVFKQHVARENVSSGKLANSVTVFFNGVAQLLTFHLFQPDIERHHPPLDIKMANHNLFAEIGDFFRCFLEQ